jgi:hypothetical protein
MAFKLDIENMHIDDNLCSVQLNENDKPFVTITCYRDKMGDLINLVSKLNNVTLISKSYIKIM